MEPNGGPHGPPFGFSFVAPSQELYSWCPRASWLTWARPSMSLQIQRAESRPRRRQKPPGNTTHPAASGRPLPVPFLITIALAAFLLFSLELLAGRLMLPAFGGAPAVWTTTLCFFTAMLFVGYGYAHLIATRLPPRAGDLVHGGVALAAIVWTLAMPSDAALLKVSGIPALDVLMVLLLVVGPAAFLLASTTPLLSVWYASGGRSDPWCLYAASNAASFAALLAYPLLIAPFIPLSLQGRLLGVALVGYGVTLAWIVTAARAGRFIRTQLPNGSAEPVTHRAQALWMLAAAVPAGLLAATANFIQTDLVAAPLIWIGPLGVYLASFVVAFSERGRRVLPAVERLAPTAAILLVLPFMQAGWPIPVLLATVLAALFTLAVAIHGRLANDRPSGADLTRYYLVIALGGLLGTAFVALIAPTVFSSIYEYPLFIVAGLLVLALLPGPALSPGLRVLSDPRGACAQLAWRLLPFALVAALLYLLISPHASAMELWSLEKYLFIGTALVAAAVTPGVNAIVTPIVLGLLIWFSGTTPQFSGTTLLRERTFFGVTEVVVSGLTHTEYSGTTLHGLQFTDQRSSEPTTYYAKVGPLRTIFDDLRTRTSGATIGAVGLGVGTIATYTQRDDQLTFFEIDPAVITIAQDPMYFTYLQKTPVKPRIVAGDGRLSLGREPAASFDLLVLDAFTSDAVPAHLLTREAMAIYVRTLRPGGLLAFNLSSRFYDLPFAVGATARSLGLAVAGHAVAPDQATMEQTWATPSLWVVVGDAAGVARFIAKGWKPVLDGAPVLTDDYSDLTRLLILGRG